MDVAEMEEAWWWRWRRDCEATATAIGAALNEGAAMDMQQKFYLADHARDEE